MNNKPGVRLHYLDQISTIWTVDLTERSKRGVSLLANACNVTIVTCHIIGKVALPLAL